MYKFFFYIMICCFLMGCISKVEWVQRPGGNPSAQHWIPTCPVCHHVVDYEARQCSNPECRELLTWTDKDMYAPNSYQPALASAQKSSPTTAGMPAVSNTNPPNNAGNQATKLQQTYPSNIPSAPASSAEITTAPSATASTVAAPSPKLPTVPTTGTSTAPAMDAGQTPPAPATTSASNQPSATLEQPAGEKTTTNDGTWEIKEETWD